LPRETAARTGITNLGHLLAGRGGWCGEHRY
jgi:hypothetical protein